MEHDILVEDYIESLYLTVDHQYLNESFKDFMSNLTPPKIKQLLSKTHETSVSIDIPKFLDVVKKYGLDYKRIKPKQSLETFKQLSPDIQDGAELSLRVLRNTIPGISKTTSLVASYFVAILAKIKHYKSSNYMGAVKTELKLFASKVQQFYEEAEEKSTGNASASDMKEVAMGLAVVILIGSLTAITIYTIIMLVPYLYMAGIILIASLAGTGILWLLLKLAEAFGGAGE